MRLVPIALAMILAACSKDRGAEGNQEGANTPGASSQGAMPYGGGPRKSDNTGMNERDRSGMAPTPMDQGESEADRTISQQIRKAVEADDSLSFNAKNVKIIAKNGIVTLRGSVKNEAEKQKVEAAARSIAGNKVNDLLETEQK